MSRSPSTVGQLAFTQPRVGSNPTRLTSKQAVRVSGRFAYRGMIVDLRPVRSAPSPKGSHFHPPPLEVCSFAGAWFGTHAAVWQLFPNHKEPEVLFQAVCSHQEQPPFPEASPERSVQTLWNAIDRKAPHLQHVSVATSGLEDSTKPGAQSLERARSQDCSGFGRVGPLVG